MDHYGTRSITDQLLLRPPFTEENQRYFFGRTAEVRDIFLRVRENPLTVLCGQSGLGKTSLLRAGLIPKLRVERFRPVHVRLDFTDYAVPLVDQIRAALAAVCVGPGGDAAAVIEGWAPLPSLWEICAHKTIRPLELADNPPVLIIDQFEEVFTLGEEWGPASSARRADVVELFTQIGDLVENRAPAHLQTTFRHEPERALIYDFGPKTFRVVLSLREDFLAQVERWKDAIPSLTRNRIQLQLLSGPQALEAVVRPGRIDGHNLLSDRVGEHIVRFVAQQPDDIPLEEIQAVPPLVSLVCERLNTARLEAKPLQDEISDELVKSQGTDILQRFYDDSFAAFPEAQREVVREYVEDRMVTVGGHRNPVAREDAIAELAGQGVSEPDNVLNALIARRLLTAERRGGIQRLEITHDVLIPLIVRSRKERQERRHFEEAKRKQAEIEALTARGQGVVDESETVKSAEPIKNKIFVSFKSLDANGLPTRDSEIAMEVYEFLTAKGLDVFLSTITLEQLGVSDYTNAIDSALDAATVLVAIGTSVHHLNSKWVRYEWESFANDIRSPIKPNGRIFTYIEGMPQTALPRTLRQTQTFVHSERSLQRLFNFINQ